MTLELELPPELEQDLAAEAARVGLSLSEYAVRVLAASRLSGARPQSGAELVAFWHDAGVIGTRADIDDASAYARTLRKSAEQRERP